MKISILILSAVFAYLTFCLVSCEDPEPFVNIKVIESQIFNEIDKYRVGNGIPDADPFVHQFVMVKEAQIISSKMSYGTIDSSASEIDLHWDVIHDKIGGINDLTLLQSTTDVTAADIVANWTADTTYSELLLGDFSQCGVGVEYDTAQVAYITVLMMLVE